MRRVLAAFAVLLPVLLAASSCGGDATVQPGDHKEPEVIDVEIKGDEVSPNGERVPVSVDQDVELHVTADKPGEIHVHSDPEQEIEYPAGESTETIKGIATPGTVDVESHALDKVIVQLEVH